MAHIKGTYTAPINKTYLKRLLSDKAFWMSSAVSNYSASVINLQIDILNKEIKNHRQVQNSLASPSIIELKGIFAFIGVRYQMQYLQDIDKKQYSKASREFYNIISQDENYNYCFKTPLALPEYC